MRSKTKPATHHTERLFVSMALAGALRNHGFPIIDTSKNRSGMQTAKMLALEVLSLLAYVLIGREYYPC
jgi:hypothetical protein